MSDLLALSSRIIDAGVADRPVDAAAHGCEEVGRAAGGS
jgi:hypothetical protein